MDGLSNDLPQIPLNAPLQGRAKLRWMRRSKEVPIWRSTAFQRLPSGHLTVCYENGPFHSLIYLLKIDFPVRYVSLPEGKNRWNYAFLFVPVLSECSTLFTTHMCFSSSKIWFNTQELFQVVLSSNLVIFHASFWCIWG